MSRDLELKLQIKNPQRLDQALLEALRSLDSGGVPGLTRRSLKHCFEEKRILLEGKAEPASHVLSPGPHSVVFLGGGTLAFEDRTAARASVEGSFLAVIYEDSELLVLDKKSGIASVPHSSQETQTAVGSALAHFPALAGIGRGGLEPGLLHRLDTGTSGLLAFAKTPAEFERLRKLWREGGVRKTYRAIVQGHYGGELPRTLNLLLAHHPKSAKRMIVLGSRDKKRGRDYRGQPLSTLTRIVRLHGPSDLEIIIETGVMHQIRCTLAHLGYPILGDPIYAPKDAPEGKRLYLHAWKLELPLNSGERLELAAPLPLEFLKPFS